MDYSKELPQWLEANSIQYIPIDDRGRVIEIKEQQYLLLQNKNNRIFDVNATLILTEEELNIMDAFDIDFFIIYFGDKFYYFGDNNFETKDIKDEFDEIEGQEIRVKNINELRYIGECVDQINFPVVGIHGGYDLCNGTRAYKDWALKAKWLGITTLGLCEENTLAGTLLFQEACKKNNIKSIIGETVVVQFDSSYQYHIKLYVENITGWRNLLQINALINISKLKSIEIKQLEKHSEGLICVLTPTISVQKIAKLYTFFDKLYYQLDFVEWDNSVKEEEWLENLSVYFKKYAKQIPPIAVYDAYYLEKQDSTVQPILWRIGKRDSFKYRSGDRYFKTCNEYIMQAMSLFEEKDEDLLNQAIENASMFEEIDFIIPVGEKYLPQYELTDKQKEQFADSEQLFWHLIQEGLDAKVIDRGLDADTYIARIEEEVRVIELGHVRDYFLIVWDMLNFCREKGIRTGYGRGSAAGCLVSYLLGIVHVDPIQYDLLFERFLNESRMGKLTEIDIVTINSDYYLKITDDVQVSRNGQILNLKAISLQQEDIILNEEILRKM